MKKLFGYWRSSSSYRVRIALNLKGVEVEHVAVNLKTGAHHSEEYAKMNVQQSVPTLELENTTCLTQSLAILDYLEEAFPTPALLPEDPVLRAKIRSAAQIIAADISPIQNLRVLKHVRAQYGQDEEGISSWVRHFITEGFTSLELIAQSSKTRYLFTDVAGYFECCLIPQIYNANRFKVDMAQFPRLEAMNRAALDLPAFQKAIPEYQHDAPA